MYPKNVQCAHILGVYYTKVYAVPQKSGKLFPKNVRINQGYTMVSYMQCPKKVANCSLKMCALVRGTL